MAPPHDLFDTVFKSTTAGIPIANLSLGQHATAGIGALSSRQSRIVLVISLASASASLGITAVALYWFVRMRKSFRHRLIILLIAGDLFKAFWYFVFPIVSFVRGPTKSYSTYCQASGYFLAVGTEAPDVAVLAIAVHAALYIFRDLHRGSEGGLYPYRCWVYVTYVLWPLITASLAFVDNDVPFVNFGIYCYLPKRPYWYRLVLSWIPRYMILCTVFCVYASIYFLVQIKFKGFDNLDSTVDSTTGGHDSTNDDLPHPGPEGDSPSTLVPSSVICSRRASTTSAKLLTPDSKADPVPPESQAVPEWEKIDYVGPDSLADKLRRGSGISASDFALGADMNRTLTPSAEAVGHSRNTSGSSNNTMTPLAQKISDVRTKDIDETPQDASGNRPSGRRRRPPPTQLAATRRAIKRQLRFMFIYPLVYVFMWTIPFISHCFNYNDYWAAHPPFTLTILSTACTGLQAGVDSIVFSWRERPWTRPHASKPLRKEETTHVMLKLFGIGTPRSEAADVHERPRDSNTGSAETRPPTVRRASRKGAHWWEWEGGRLRKESVWTATEDSNSPSPPLTQKARESNEGAHDVGSGRNVEQR